MASYGWERDIFPSENKHTVPKKYISYVSQYL